jgi:hypothetical protein
MVCTAGRDQEAGGTCVEPFFCHQHRPPLKMDLLSHHTMYNCALVQYAYCTGKTSKQSQQLYKSAQSKTSFDQDVILREAYHKNTKIKKFKMKAIGLYAYVNEKYNCFQISAFCFLQRRGMKV